MAEPEINAFLTYLAVKEKVSASTQNQALSALLFLYRHMLEREVGDLGEVIRARDGKGAKGRITMLPESLKASLQERQEPRGRFLAGRRRRLIQKPYLPPDCRGRQYNTL